MQKHSSPPFKTKYVEPVKGDTSIGSTWFSTSSKEPASMKQHASAETRPEPLNIGLIGLSVTALPDCGKGIARDAPVGFLPRTRRDCERRYGSLQGNWDTIKTCGMVCSSLTISGYIMLFPSVCGNVKGYFTSWDSPCKGPAVRLVRLILSDRRPLKKLLPMDERPRYSALV